MSEQQTASAAKPKRPIEVLRERRGGIPKELKESFAEQQRIRKALKAALQAGPKTVPELANEIGVASPTLMWHLMAMRRYGEVVDGPERDRYLLYYRKGAEPCTTA